MFTFFYIATGLYSLKYVVCSICQKFTLSKTERDTRANTTMYRVICDSLLIRSFQPIVFSFYCSLQYAAFDEKILFVGHCPTESMEF